jgi:hypothetical protein
MALQFENPHQRERCSFGNVHNILDTTGGALAFRDDPDNVSVKDYKDLLVNVEREHENFCYENRFEVNIAGDTVPTQTKGVTIHIRSEELQWIFDSNKILKLHPSTISLAMELFDRGLCVVDLAIDSVRAFTVACIHFAAKLKEPTTPSFYELRKLCTFNVMETSDFEKQVLMALITPTITTTSDVLYRIVFKDFKINKFFNYYSLSRGTWLYNSAVRVSNFLKPHVNIFHVGYYAWVCFQLCAYIHNIDADQFPYIQTKSLPRKMTC